jgi:hypothetical protein
MESNMEKMDKQLEKTKEEHASIENLPPIPAGPPVKSDDKEEAPKTAAAEGGAVDPAIVKTMVTE